MQDTIYELDYHDVSGEIDRAFEDLNEQIDWHERVGDLVDCVESIEKPSLETIQVILRAVDVAFVGTPYSSKDLRVAVEGVEDAVALESIKGALATIRKSIVAAIQAIIDLIKRAWNTLTNNVERLNFRLKRSKSVAKSMRGRSLSNRNKIPVAAGQNYLKLNGVVVASGTIVSHGMDQLRLQLKAVLDLYVPGVKNIGNGILSTLSSDAKPEEVLVKLNEICAKLPVRDVASKISARTQVDGRWSLDKPVMVGPPLLGDKSLYCYSFEPSEDALAASNEIRTFRVSLNDNKNQRQAVGEIDALSVDMVIAILDKIEGIVSDIKESDGGDLNRQLEAMKKSIEQAAARLERKESRKSVDEAILKYSSAFASWAAAPRVAIMQHTVLCCEAIITLCNRSLAHYK